jgi:transcriptional regulator with XRE-family HTH domain
VPQLRRIEAGARLRECRLGVHLRQEDVSRELAAMGRPVSDSTLSSYESGRRTIDAFTLADLCLIYGVSTDYVLYGTHMIPQELRAIYQRAGGGV